MNLRNVVIALFTCGWLAIVVVAAVDNHGSVPGVLWPFLGFGVGTTLAAFSRGTARLAREEREPCSSS